MCHVNQGDGSESPAERRRRQLAEVRAGQDKVQGHIARLRTEAPRLHAALLPLLDDLGRWMGSVGGVLQALELQKGDEKKPQQAGVAEAMRIALKALAEVEYGATAVGATPNECPHCGGGKTLGHASGCMGEKARRALWFQLERMGEVGL